MRRGRAIEKSYQRKKRGVNANVVCRDLTPACTACVHGAAAETKEEFTVRFQVDGPDDARKRYRIIDPW